MGRKYLYKTDAPVGSPVCWNTGRGPVRLSAGEVSELEPWMEEYERVKPLIEAGKEKEPKGSYLQLMEEASEPIPVKEDTPEQKTAEAKVDEALEEKPSSDDLKEKDEVVPVEKDLTSFQEKIQAMNAMQLDKYAEKELGIKLDRRKTLADMLENFWIAFSKLPEDKKRAAYEA